ncbi:MAG: hypothetical protein R3D00_15630 [Bacteroidia bacterium]
MIKHTKTVRKFTYITGIAAIVVGIIGIVSVLSILQYRKSQAAQVNKPCAAFISEDLSPISFQVKVTHVTKENTHTCFETENPVAGRTSFCMCLSMDLERRFTISAGDIFSKEAGSDMVTFLKTAGNQSATFSYPCCN